MKNATSGRGVLFFLAFNLLVIVLLFGLAACSSSGSGTDTASDELTGESSSDSDGSPSTPDDGDSGPAFTTLYFWASDGEHGYELWITDGSVAGTEMVADINPGAGSSYGFYTEEPVIVDGIGYFGANNGTTGEELWRTDGTAEGTYQVIDIADPNNAIPQAMVAIDGLLYYSASTDTTQSELWVSDGTEEGTMMIGEINSNDAPFGSSTPREFTAFQDKVYFTATDGATMYGRELWAWDGEAVAIAADIQGGTASSIPDTLTVWNGELFFTAYDSGVERELYHFDGTTASIVGEVDETDGSSSPSTFFALDSLLLFSATDNGAATGREWYKYDGSTISLVADINPGSGDGSPIAAQELDGVVYFFAYNGASQDFWRTDGETTEMILALGSDAPNNLKWFRKVGDGFLFLALTDVDGEILQRLWASDGTSEGTIDVTDATGLSEWDSCGFELGEATEALIFTYDSDGDGDYEIWRTDGTSEGTFQILDGAGLYEVEC